MPAAVPADRKPPIWWSVWLIFVRRIWGWIRQKFAGVISYPLMRFPIRLRSFSATTAETILRRWTRPWNWLTTAGFRHGPKKPSREANCAALVYLPTSKPAVLRPPRRWVSWVPESVCGKVRRCALTRQAMCRFLPAHTRMDRVMRRHLRSWSAISWACLSRISK